MQLLRLKFPEYFLFISILIAYWKQFHVALAGSMARLGHSWMCIPGWPWTTDPPSTAGINMPAPHTELLFSFLFPSFVFFFLNRKRDKEKNLHLLQTHSKMCQALQWELWQITAFWKCIHLPNISYMLSVKLKFFSSSFHPTAKQFHTFLKSSLFTVFTQLCICD